MYKLVFLSAILISSSMTALAQADEKPKRDIVHQEFGKIDFRKKLYSENVTNYTDLPTQIAKKYGSYASLPLDRRIAEQVRLWVSIRYKCGYCTVFHTQDARDSGIDTHKVDNITAYKTSDLFSAKEKAALDYAAAISYVDYDKLPEATAEVKKHFTEAEIESIIMSTVLMDIWARVFAAQGNTPYYNN